MVSSASGFHRRLLTRKRAARKKSAAGRGLLRLPPCRLQGSYALCIIGCENMYALIATRNAISTN
jgi:hypothetical protein